MDRIGEGKIERERGRTGEEGRGPKRGRVDLITNLQWFIKDIGTVVADGSENSNKVGVSDLLIPFYRKRSRPRFVRFDTNSTPKSKFEADFQKYVLSDKGRSLTQVSRGSNLRALKGIKKSNGTNGRTDHVPSVLHVFP